MRETGLLLLFRDGPQGYSPLESVDESEALLLLIQKPIDAAVLSPPLQEGQVRTVVEALVRRGVPFVIHERRDDKIAEELRDALETSRRPH